MTAWTEHVKTYASSRGISYREALKDPDCKASYTKTSSSAKKPRAKKEKSFNSIMAKHHEKTIHQPKGYERVYKGDSMLKDVLARIRAAPGVSKGKKKLYPAGGFKTESKSDESKSSKSDDLVGESKGEVGGGGGRLSDGSFDYREG